LGIGDLQTHIRIVSDFLPRHLMERPQHIQPALRPFLCAVATALRLTMAQACNELALRHQFKQATPGYVKALKKILVVTVRLSPI
jgi:hypothetical protein